MPQILVVERVGDKVYVYREDLKHHAIVQEDVASNNRPVAKRVDFDVFDSECNVMRALDDGEWTSAVIL